MVKEHSLDATVRELSQAMLAGPGASRASKVTGELPTEMPSAADQVKSGLDAKSGIAVAIEFTLAACELSNVAIASAAVAPRDTDDEKENRGAGRTKAATTWKKRDSRSSIMVIDGGSNPTNLNYSVPVGRFIRMWVSWSGRVVVSGRILGANEDQATKELTHVADYSKMTDVATRCDAREGGVKLRDETHF